MSLILKPVFPEISADPSPQPLLLEEERDAAPARMTLDDAEWLPRDARSINRWQKVKIIIALHTNIVEARYILNTNKTESYRFQANTLKQYMQYIADIFMFAHNNALLNGLRLLTPDSTETYESE
jgi:hypothetical protein